MRVIITLPFLFLALTLFADRQNKHRPLTHITAEKASGEAYFKYDISQTDRYFEETYSLHSDATGAVSEIVKMLLNEETAELLSKQWGPWVLYSRQHTPHHVRLAYFNCVDEMMTALALAWPYMNEENQEKAKKYVKKEFIDSPSFQSAWNNRSDNFRHGYKLENLRGYVHRFGAVGDHTRPKQEEKDRAAFMTLYGVWAWANATDDWSLAKQVFPMYKKLLNSPALKDWDWRPDWLKGWKERYPEGAVFTKAVAEDERFHFETRRIFHYDVNGFYQVWPLGDQDANCFLRFSPPRVLSALIAYGRLAKRFGDTDQEKWAKDTFNQVAKDSFRDMTGVLGFASAWQTPESARIFRDTAGTWYDKHIKDHSGIFYGKKKHGYPNDGPWISVIDMHQAHLSRLGSLGAVPPRVAMANFLTKAWIEDVSTGELNRILDIPWAKADYWYIQKCAVLLSRQSRTTGK